MLIQLILSKRFVITFTSLSRRSVPAEGRRGDVLAGVCRSGEPDVHVAGDVDGDAAAPDRQDSSQGRQGRAIHHALCQRSGKCGISR